MKNFVQDGDILTLTPAADVASGVGYLFGTALYWDATNKVVNKTTSGQRAVGIAVAAAANPSSTVAMRLGVNSLAGT